MPVISRARWTVTAGLAACLAAGCVEQRYVVTTDPPGAIILRNYQQIGAAPADDHFVYYGKYHFTVIKDGYETLQVDEVIKTPWYEYFPLDFISENLVPWKIHDVRRFHYHLEPARTPNTAELLKQAQELRLKGQSIGVPAAPVPMVAAPASPPVMPAQVPPPGVPVPAALPATPPPGPVGAITAPVAPSPTSPAGLGR
jgi:hypothetical protein